MGSLVADQAAKPTAAPRRQARSGQLTARKLPCLRARVKIAMQPAAFMAAPARGQVAPASNEPAAANVATTLQISQLNWFECTRPERTAAAMRRNPISCSVAAARPLTA